MELKHNMDYDLFLHCLTECADRINETWFRCHGDGSLDNFEHAGTVLCVEREPF